MRIYLKWMALAGILQLSCFSASSQTTINGGRVITGAWDASNAASSRPAKTGTALPPTCNTGEQFFKTDATPGQNLYFCTTGNTWVQMTGGNGSGGGSGSGGTSSVLIYKGDLAGYSSQPTRIPVGPDGSTLTADSTQSSGLGYRTGSGSDIFANRPACTPALTGETYYPTDGILGYRCNGTTWTAFGPISPITPFRVSGSNAFGVVGTGSSVLAAAALSTGALTLNGCQNFPATVTMVLVDFEIIAGTCSGTTFTPITGGRGYNQTVASTHSAGAAATEQLFVWANYRSGASTQVGATVAANAGYIALAAQSTPLSMLTKPLPNGPTASYTVTAGFLMSSATTGDQGCGIGFRQSSNNDIALLQFHSITYSQTGFTLGEYTIADGALNSQYFADLAVSSLTGNGLYFRLQDTLSQRNTYVSTDGLNFVLVHSVAEGDFLSPDQVFISCTGSFNTQIGSFYSWSEGN